MIDLSAEEVEALRVTFDKYDKNANSWLNWDEFCLLLDELVGEMPLEEKPLAFHIVDTDHTGVINFEEFITWWGGRS